MNLNGKILVAVAMVLGAMATTGCKSGSESAQAEGAAPVIEQSASNDAPAAKDEVATVVATSTVRLAAPPALRVESPGRAPSAHHVWQRGYWRYDAPTTVYVWAPGYWEDETVRAPYGPPVVRYEEPGYAPSAEYLFVPGSWRWSGREYVWTYGHWTHRRDVGFYYSPRWENVNGHWEHHMDRWDHDRVSAWDRDHGNHGDRDHGGQGHAGHEGQGHPGQGHADQGHAGQGHEGQGHPGQGHGDQGHAGQGHADQGHPSQGHPAQGQPGHGQADQGQAHATARRPADQTPTHTPAAVVHQAPARVFTPVRRVHS